MDRPIELFLRGGQFKQYTEQELLKLRNQYDLKKIELEIVCFLSISKECDTAANIHEYLSANKGHVSQAMFHLCERGFVISTQDKKDRRYVHYSLTEQGQKLARELTDVWDGIRKEIFDGVTEEELECFKRVTLIVRENIRKKLNV